MSPESRVDVLIIGAGPAGLMCANALAAAGADVRIIDKRPIKVAGHADGIQPRTTEVLQSYGLAERLIREGNQLHMGTFYSPGRDGVIEWANCIPCVDPPTSTRYPFVITLHQGAIEAIFLDSMRDHGVEVERPKQPMKIRISDEIAGLSSTSSYPVKVALERLNATERESRTEIVHAKYVIGTDGAHSWVRDTLGIKMEGRHTEDIWGVVEFIPETDFPDIRNPTTIQSESGSLIIIPREGDLVRFYIQLLDTDVTDSLTGRVDKSKITPKKIVSIAKKIFHPFKLAEPKEIGWWTIYIVGQCVASSYSVKDRVFIAGDACHTHSPKGGQGMNASMNDTHNLAWKLIQVLRGWSSPLLLKTYEQERRKFAQDLIKFDQEFAILFSGRPKTVQNEGGVSDEQLKLAFQTFGKFLSGAGVHYSPSTIVDPKHQNLANNLVIGKRMPPQIFVRAADIRPVDVQDVLPADVRFKLLFFVGNLTEARITELKLLAEELRKSSSFLHKYSPDGNSATVFDIITIASGKKKDVNYLLVPPFFRPHWSKVLLDDTDVTRTMGGHGYKEFGVDPEVITLVVVRPDGYVGTIAPSTALSDLEGYFGSFMLARGHHSYGVTQHQVHGLGHSRTLVSTKL